MPSMFELEKLVDEIVKRVDLLATHLGIEFPIEQPIQEPEAEPVIITEEQTDPDA